MYHTSLGIAYALVCHPSSKALRNAGMVFMICLVKKMNMISASAQIELPIAALHRESIQVIVFIFYHREGVAMERKKEAWMI